MRCIRSHTTDPYFNLAAEEYFMKQSEEPVYFQYINRDAVVIGKHQNALAEMDLDFLEDNDILLARRISGGGAVYHDPGNLNFAFLTQEAQGNYIRFEKYTAPIIEALDGLGVKTLLGKRNEILLIEDSLPGENNGSRQVDGAVADSDSEQHRARKISGTASHVFKNRVLHHGTLLFEANLEKLGRCLYTNRDRIVDKAVRSVRSEVANIRDILKEPLSMQAFSEYIFSRMVEAWSGKNKPLEQEEIDAIGNLRSERFLRWDWNYGYSPRYEIRQEVDYPGGKVRFYVLVVKGMIARLEVTGDPGTDIHLLDHMLIGRQHNKALIQELLKGEGLDYDIFRRILQGIF